MRITIEEIERTQEEEIIVRCHQTSEALLRMVSRLNRVQADLVGFRGEEIHRLALEDIFYFEVVDGKSFLYGQSAVFESRLKLYEFEQICADTAFFRASKSMVLNADKIEYISPSFSGRFEATLLNGERIKVSRQYVAMLKKKMGL